MDPLNPSPPTSESEPEDAIEVENPTEHKDEIVPASFHEVGEPSTALLFLLHEDIDGLLPGLMRRDINSIFSRMASLLRQLCGPETAHALVEKKGKAKDEFYGKLILDLGNEVRSSMEQGTNAMEKLVEKLGNAKDQVECKKLKRELEEARIMPPKSAPLTQAAIRRMIKDERDEEEEYPFVNKYLSFQEEPIVLVEEESCPVYDTNNEEEQSLLVYDTDLKMPLRRKKDLLGKEDLVGKKTTYKTL
nr:hypothetical protein [Tanacetum cinerariifolium]